MGFSTISRNIIFYKMRKGNSTNCAQKKQETSIYEIEEQARNSAQYIFE